MIEFDKPLHLTEKNKKTEKKKKQGQVFDL